MNAETVNLKDDLAATYSDFYKEVHGIRPRWVNYDEVTVEWYEEALRMLSAESKIVFAAEAKARANAAVVVEARIAELIAIGAGDRLTAIRWLHEAEGTNNDPEYLCYCLGVEYGYFRADAALADSLN